MVVRGDAGARGVGRIVPAGVMALIVGFVGICGLGGCGDGGSGDHGGLIGPREATPDHAWQSLQQSLNGRDADGWAGALALTFEYVPDPASAAGFPGAFTSWDRQIEIAFVQALFAAGVELDAELVANGSVCPSPSGTTVTWPGVEYSVVVAGSDGASPVTYRGVADLEFGLDGSFWYLARWVDLRGAPAPWNEDVLCPTLGELRAVYRGHSCQAGI